MAFLSPAGAQLGPARPPFRRAARAADRLRPQADHQPGALESAGLARRLRLAPGQPLPQAGVGLSQPRDFLCADGPRDRSAYAEVGLHAASSRAAILRGDLDMDCSKLALGTAMSDEVLEQVGLSASDAVELAARTGRPCVVEPLSGARIGHQPVGPQAAAVHQRLCARDRLRPRRVGVPAGPSRCRSDPSRRWSITKSCTNGPGRTTPTE